MIKAVLHLLIEKDSYYISYINNFKYEEGSKDSDVSEILFNINSNKLTKEEAYKSLYEFIGEANGDMLFSPCPSPKVHLYLTSLDKESGSIYYDLPDYIDNNVKKLVYLPFRIVLDYFEANSIEDLGEKLKEDRNVEIDFDDHIEIAQDGVLFYVADTEFTVGEVKINE
jgi:hypothetical protein